MERISFGFPWRDFAHAVEGAYQLGSELVQFASVGFGESFEGVMAGGGELENDEAMIGVGLEALNEAGFGATLA
jgi:hypothetical protein